MKRLLILGAGTGGTIMAQKMRKDLSKAEWDITIIEKSREHYYQPGFLFVPFGFYKKETVVKPTARFIPKGVNLIFAAIENIDADNQKVSLENGTVLEYDILIIATGTRIAPEETPGMLGELWQKKIFDFYTNEGSVALSEFFKTWQGGNLVINIADMPIKCPVAPLEFAFYADDYFKRRGIRDKVNITYVTPLSGAFTKPKASKMFGSLFVEKNINLVTDFYIGEVNNEKHAIVDFAGKEIPFDCLVTVPLHTGDPVIEKSGLGDDFGFVRANKHTLQSEAKENIFVIGDAGNFPASKAGSVVHFQADILHENLLSFINSEPLKAEFDGHANCFIETGEGKGILIDFNYETEPLPGKFPWAVIGPMGLLKVTRLNHYGKLAFKWIYWNILLKARWLPFTTNMSRSGKIFDKN